MQLLHISAALRQDLGVKIGVFWGKNGCFRGLRVFCGVFVVVFRVGWFLYCEHNLCNFMYFGDA